MKKKIVIIVVALLVIAAVAAGVVINKINQEKKLQAEAEAAYKTSFEEVVENMRTSTEAIETALDIYTSSVKIILRGGSVDEANKKLSDLSLYTGKYNKGKFDKKIEELGEVPEKYNYAYETLVEANKTYNEVVDWVDKAIFQQSSSISSNKTCNDVYDKLNKAKDLINEAE